MADNLSVFVVNVRRLSESGNFRDLTDILNGTIKGLSRDWKYLDNVLDVLQYERHSLGVLYVLIAKFSRLPIPNEGILDYPMRLFEKFINECNVEQVRFATNAYYKLCHMFANLIVDTPTCIMGIKILASAIEKIRLFETQLTPVHSDLLKLSLKAKYFKLAYKFLDIVITSISTGAETRPSSPSDANNDSKFVLLYHYYGGMIYTAAKKFDDALYFFKVCMSIPASALSHIVVEAYKKYILVSLISGQSDDVQGSVVPGLTSQGLDRLVLPHIQIYLDLVDAFATSIDKYNAVVTQYAENFKSDKNMGLVKQILSAMYKKNILRLTRAYMTIPLPSLITNAQLPDSVEADRFVLKMIKNGEINATIDQKGKMVTFKSDQENYNSLGTVLKLQKTTEMVLEMAKKVRKMEEEILLNPTYIMKISQKQDNATTSQTMNTIPPNKRMRD